MKPTATMLRRPEFTPRLRPRSAVKLEKRESESSGDPVGDRRVALLRALEETRLELREKSIQRQVETRLGERSTGLVSEPSPQPAAVVARLVGYDRAADGEPTARLPLGGVSVQLALSEEEFGRRETGATGLVLFELPEETSSPYSLRILGPNDEVLARAEGKVSPGSGGAHLVEIGRASSLEPAFARGRNLILAARRAEERGSQIGAKVEKALARQEELLRKEIADLDAMLAIKESQGKGESDGSDAQS